MRLLTVRNAVISLLLAVAATAMYVAFVSSRDEPPPARLPSAIEAVSPRPGALALRQDHILVDLTAGHTGVLRVGGVEIPDDQLQRTEGLSQISYTPGPGTETGPLAPGVHRVTVSYWLTTETRETRAKHFTWQFTVH